VSGEAGHERETRDVWPSRRLLSRLMPGLVAPPELPTVDYYVLAGLADLVGRPGSAAPIVRLGPHAFAAGRHLLLVRYAEAEELALLAPGRFARVTYLVDDMLPIAAACGELPAAYRARLARFAADVLPRILDVATEVVAPRAETLALFPGHEGSLLDPAHLHVAADHDHFETLAASRPGNGPHHARGPGSVRLAFLGTRSHGAGLEFLEEIALGLARRGTPVTLTTFLGKHVPPRLAGFPGLDNRPPLAWEGFKRFQRRERFHLLLAPLPDTPFNKGRSITKLMDVAAVGAAGLLADRAPFAGRLRDGEEGLLLPDEPTRWVEAIDALVAEPARARALAEGGARLARRLGDPARVRRFWLERFDLAA
jgi:hypothetical protein